MLAGLGPVPAVMFIVAADGGWMPQSAEHLAAVDALGVRHGLLVITRSDLADPEPATRQALAEIGRTSLGAVEAIPVSAVTGQGLDNLRAALTRLVASLSSGPARARSVPGESEYRPADAPVRLWIDRSFTIRGAGTVVTGTLPAGTVSNGKELVLAPAGRPVRVRGLEALGEPADAVTGVARIALNLRGIPADLPQRGMALVEPGRWTIASEIDVRITPQKADPNPKFPPPSLSTSARQEPRPGCGYSAPTTPPGPPLTSRRAPAWPQAAIYARVRLKDPLPLHAGDRVILRDPGAAGLAIYGGRVLDPFPPPLARRGAAAAAVRELNTWPDTPGAADLLRRHKLLRAPQLTAAGLADLPSPVAGDWLADPEYWAWLGAELPKVVAAFCAKDPLAPGMPAEAARGALSLPSRDLVPPSPGMTSSSTGRTCGSSPSAVPSQGTPPLSRRAQRLPGQAKPPRAARGPRDNSRPGSPTRSRRSSTASRAIPSRPRTPNGSAPSASMPARWPRRPASACCCASPTWSSSRPAPTRRRPRILAGLEQPFTTSQARQALRTSRRVAIPLLEYLDRTRVTERLPGDLRRLRS